MISHLDSYTTKAIARLVGIDYHPAFGFDSYPKEEATSAAVFWNLRVNPWIVLGKEKNASFIGIISDEEARLMKNEITSFKDRFDYDLARRNKILFGE